MIRTLLIVGITVVTLLGCGKTPEGLPIPGPSPEPTAVPTVTPTPTPKNEFHFRFNVGVGKNEIQAKVNAKGEVRILNYPKLFDSTLSVVGANWSNAFNEDPDKNSSPYSRYTCEKYESFAKVAGSTSAYIPEETKQNALSWLRNSHEVLLRASLPHLPGIGESFTSKIKQLLSEKNYHFETITLLNPLSPHSIELISIEKKKESSLTLKAGHIEGIKNRFKLFFSNIAPTETPFVQESLAFRDVLCDLSEEAITLRFQISTAEKSNPEILEFLLNLKKEEQE